jgi:DNA primase
MEDSKVTDKGLVDFDRVRELADFTAILAHYGIAVPPGRVQTKIACPFHEETKPSCSVNLAAGVFHCFGGGCEASGNVIDFVLRMEDSDGPVAAARRVASICGFDVPMKAENSSERPLRGHRRPEERRKGSGTTKEAAGPGNGSTGPPGAEETVNPPLTFQLKLDPEHPYREQRGAWLTAEWAADFGLGVCTRGMMKGRWCIPIHDLQGDLVAYAGRWVGPDEALPEGEDRYKLPPRFRKTQVLFNAQRAAQLSDGPVIVVEGYFGALRLHSLGVPAVALMGSSISAEQVALLRAWPLVTLLMDGDQPGREAAARLLPVLAERHHVHVAALPDGLEPDTAPEAELRGLLDIP